MGAGVGAGAADVADVAHVAANESFFLGDLVELEALREICARASELEATGVEVWDEKGTILIEAGPLRPFGAARLSRPRVGTPALVSSPDGARCFVGAIENGQGTIGFVAVGPYRTPARDHSAGLLCDLLARSASALARAEKAKRTATEVDRLKASFLATVSHELRTPLTSVIGYSEMLLEGLAGDLLPEQKEYVRTIMDKGDQLLSIISSILEISRIEAGSVRLERSPVDPAQLCAEVAQGAMPQAGRRHVRLELSLPAKAPILEIDRDKARQALVHVVGNAIKFTPDGGHVQVAVREVEKGVEISVRDTGIGITAAALPHVFDAFFQADSSSTREYGGAGLGLTIARSFIVANGGEINVESVPGAGTTVTILLPCAQAARELGS
jgi:signal transduction histidine kinase